MPSTSRVVVFGGFGQVGEALVATAAAAGRAPEDVVLLGRAEADIGDPDAVAAALAEHTPRLIVNCAVFQPVDLCESEPDRAFAINAVAAGRLARACRAAGARLVHVSTDYVFGGERRRPYPEDALPAPRNIYAASKLAGEHLVLAASETHAVVRTSAVFGTARAGHGTAPFVERMLARARAGQATRVVNDQVVSPTFAEDLAAGLWSVVGCGGSGTFHIANHGAATWFQVAEVVFEAAGVRALLSPTTALEFGAPAARPAYTALDCRRMRDLCLAELPSWRSALARYLRARHPDLAV